LELLGVDGWVVRTLVRGDWGDTQGWNMGLGDGTQGLS